MEDTFLFQTLQPTLAYFLLTFVGIAIGLDCQHDVARIVSARNVFLITIAAWYLLEAVIRNEVVSCYSQDEYDTGLVYVGLCLVGFLVVYHAVRGGAFDAIYRRLIMVDNPFVLWAIFLAAVFVGFLPLLVFARGNILMILDDAFVPKARFSGVFQRGRYGGIRDAFLEMQMFLRAAIPLAAAVVAQREQPNGRKVTAGMFLVYAFARAFNSGTRSQVIEVFLPIAAAIYWRLNAEQKKNAVIFGIPTIAVIGLVWSAAAVVTRNQGYFELSKAADAKYIGFEMFRELLFLSNTIPDRSPHRFGYTYYTQLVNPIPRFLWPGKPDGDAGLLLADLQGAGAGRQASLTVSPGLIGEMYWNFGVAGIIAISGVLGYLAKSWDRIRDYSSRSLLAFVVYAAGLAIIFLSGRSINMSTLYGMMALYVLLIYFSQRGRG